jgi:hypothetical protein
VLVGLVVSVAPNRGAADSAATLNVTGGPGTTSVQWDTGSGMPGQVYVSPDGAPEELFAEGITGSQEAPWFTANTRYEFRLYAGQAHDRQLASVVVDPTPGANVRDGAPLLTLPMPNQAFVGPAVGLVLVVLAL